jgi:hypothetical protein
MRQLLIIVLFILTSNLQGQVLTYFSYSECQNLVDGDSSKITIEGNKGHTKIDLRTYGSCNGQFEGRIEVEATGNLNLIFLKKTTKYINNAGEEYEVLEITDCNCLFDFKYVISNLKTIDAKAVTINGLTLAEIDRRNIGTEIEVIVD